MPRWPHVRLSRVVEFTVEGATLRILRLGNARHAYASAAHELGLGELTIKALLGHARLGVTSGYIATVDSVVQAAAENVSSYIVGAMSGETGRAGDIVGV